MFIRFSVLRASVALALLAVIAGCSTSPSAPAAPVVSVSVSPTTATLASGGAQAFTATVGNDTASAGVTWSIGTGAGTLSSSTTTGVTYTAPSVVTAGTVTLIATSKTDTTKSASATITLNAVSVAITTMPVAMIGGATQTFAATVTNDGATTGVTWSASVGSITSGGVYTAPTVVATASATVTATSKTDTSKSASVTVPLTAISLGTISPATGTVTLGVGQTQAFTETVANDGSSSGVSWAITSGLGTLTSATTTGVTYNAPTTTLGAASTATLTATSVKDPTKTASAVINLVPVVVTLTSGTGLTLDAGQSAAVSASVTGDATASGVTFSTSSGGVGATTPGAASVVVAGNSPASTYFAPATVATSTFATLVATSVKDVTKSGSTTVNLNPAISITPGSSASTTTLTGALTNSAYSQTLTKTTGTGTGTFTFALAAGGTGVPTGLTLSTAGVLSGTITATPGTYTFTVKVTDQASTPASVSFNYSLAVTAAPLVFTTPTLATGTVGTAYSQQLTATGGTGTLTYAVNSGTLPTGITISASGLLSGTPTSPTVVAGNPLTFKVTDSATVPVTQTTGLANLIVNPVTLVITSSALPNGAVSSAYSYQLTSTGGTGTITWTKTAGTFPNGLSVSTSGLISGTPTATATATSLTFQAQDSATNQQQTKSVTLPLTIGVSTSGSITGQISSVNGCGGGLSGITVSINTSPVQTTTTNSSGGYTFNSIPNGTYTLTPSITGPSSVFYPATQSATVNSNTVTSNFSGSLGYTVSGTVAYTGSKTGQIYLALNNTTCGGNFSPGTSLTAKGAFTIRGVPPGSYTLKALMDNLNNGASNTANPSGTSSIITVAAANVTGATVTLSDPATTTITSAPSIDGVSPYNGGVLIQYEALTNNGVEQAISYTVQWSTTAAFTTVAGSKTFAANGNNGATLWFVNGLTNASTYYFRAYGTSAGTATGPYSTVTSAVTVGAPAGGNTISGAVTFTGTATGPLVVGFYNLNTGVFYGQSIASPVSPQAFTVQVPTGTAFYFVGVIDQNGDGIVTAGDISNITGSNPPTVAITGATTGQNLTLPSANAAALALTQHYNITTSSSTSDTYNVQFQVYGLLKRPVAVALTTSSNTSGANFITTTDLAVCGGNNSNCGGGVQTSFNLGTVAPAVGDTYTFTVTYSDGTTGTVTGTVSAVLSAFTTNLAPVTGTSTSLTPTFSWTDPANASNYTYSFFLGDNNGNNLWQISGKNNNGGFASTITSIPWNTDPTGNGNLPSVSTLTHGTLYNWSITTSDSNGNQAVKQVPYQP